MVLFRPIRTLIFHPIQTLTAGAIGAAVVYLLDPENGEQRRAHLSEQVKSQVNSLRQGPSADSSGGTTSEPVLIPPLTETAVTDVTDMSGSGVPPVSHPNDTDLAAGNI